MKKRMNGLLIYSWTVGSTLLAYVIGDVQHKAEGLGNNNRKTYDKGQNYRSNTAYQKTARLCPVALKRLVR
jgi:hypothetical protein